MHAATGINVHAQWLGLLRKLEAGSQATAGDVVLKLGASQSAYVLNHCREDAVQLVAAWIVAIRQDWPRLVTVASFPKSADAIVETTARLRTMSHGSAEPLHWRHAPSEGDPGMRSDPEPRKRQKTVAPPPTRKRHFAKLKKTIAPPPTREKQFAKGKKTKARPPTRKKKTFAPGYLVKHFAKCILHRYDIGARLRAEFGGGNSPPPNSPRQRAPYIICARGC